MDSKNGYDYVEAIRDGYAGPSISYVSSTHEIEPEPSITHMNQKTYEKPPLPADRHMNDISNNQPKDFTIEDNKVTATSKECEYCYVI